MCKNSRHSDAFLSANPWIHRCPETKGFGEKPWEKRKLPPCHPLVKNEHTARRVHKSVLAHAYLRACVYELSWMCVLSLHESAVITRWRCPWGGSHYIWLSATSPSFYCCLCLTEKLLCASVHVDWWEQSVSAYVCVCVRECANFMSTENKCVPHVCINKYHTDYFYDCVCFQKQ